MEDLDGLQKLLLACRKVCSSLETCVVVTSPKPWFREVAVVVAALWPDQEMTFTNSKVSFTGNAVAACLAKEIFNQWSVEGTSDACGADLAALLRETVGFLQQDDLI